MESEYQVYIFLSAYQTCFNNHPSLLALIKSDKSAKFVRELVWKISPYAKEEHREFAKFYNKILVPAGYAAHTRCGSNPFISGRGGDLTVNDLFQALAMANKHEHVCNAYKAHTFLNIICHRASEKAQFIREIAEGIIPLKNFLLQVYLSKMNDLCEGDSI